MYVFAGIDVGKKGALSIIKESGELYYTLDYNDDLSIIVESLKEITKEHTIKMAMIEKVASMPRQGVKSMFSFGENYGKWQGILSAFEIPYDFSRPQEWMKEIGVPKGTDKHGLAKKCTQLYPKAKDVIYSPRGALKDGRSDSILICHYCRLKYGSKE
jgi:hypothetical protein